MEQRLLLALALLVTGCAPSPPVTHQQWLLVAMDHVQLGSRRLSVTQAIAELGPAESTQVIVKACPSFSFSAVSQVVDRLKAAGYERVGFGTMNPSEIGLCSEDYSRPAPHRDAN